MSEYQYYEFLAIDRPLDEQEQADIRSLSTRAEITATSFVNEYEWGDFSGDPTHLVERYYDAHLYLADWGTRCLMLRLPRTALPADVARQYHVDELMEVSTTGDHVILGMVSDDEQAEWDYEPAGALSTIVEVRRELADGDHRALYLAWLAAYGTWERDEDAFDSDAEADLEPLVPAGMGRLTSPQRELAAFLRLDDDLLAVAADAPASGDRRTVAELLDRAALRRHNGS